MYTYYKEKKEDILNQKRVKKHDEFNLENTIDDQPFPNKDVKGYEYRK
tara:strand:+ start:76 stop:219 length:144 start_codon:yes stop_codon:yes gene_type:complete